jgi:predicted amidohydrolase
MALAENPDFLIGVKVRMSENVIFKHDIIFIAPCSGSVRLKDSKGLPLKKIKQKNKKAPLVPPHSLWRG